MDFVDDMSQQKDGRRFLVNIVHLPFFSRKAFDFGQL